MEKPEKTTRLIRMRTLRDVALSNDNIVTPAGQEISVTEEVAKELERPFAGGYDFQGVREHAEQAKIVRAVRL